MVDAIRMGLGDLAAERNQLSAAEVKDASHAPRLSARERAADARGAFEAQVAALERLVVVAQVSEHQRQVGERTDPRARIS